MVIDRDIFRKLSTFILMGISGLWANYLVRESLVKFASNRVWRNMIGNLSLLCWIIAASGIYYAWKNRDSSIFFRLAAYQFSTVAAAVALIAGMANLKILCFSSLLMLLNFISGSIRNSRNTCQSAQGMLKGSQDRDMSSGPVILTASSGKAWSISGLVNSQEIKKACTNGLDKGFVLMDRNILEIWKRGKRLFKEIKRISKRVNSRFELKNYESTCLYIENVRQELASHLVRIQHLYDFKRKNSRGPEKIKILKMEKKIKTAIENIIKGMESMKARALIMEIGSISGLGNEEIPTCENLELADQALTGLSLAHLELDLEEQLGS